MRNLVNVATQDAYTGPNTIELDEIVRLQLQVANATIAYQVAINTHGRAIWGPETVLYPGVYSLNRSTAGVRIRSFTPGLAAIVSLDALTLQDISG